MFDAPWYDHTLLHERVAFPIFAELGLPYSCANNARVVINGDYYGLYANLERIDHEYLERNFEEPDGNLYQGGAELKTNEDVGDIADQQALASAVTFVRRAPRAGTSSRASAHAADPRADGGRRARYAAHARTPPPGPPG